MSLGDTMSNLLKNNKDLMKEWTYEKNTNLNLNCLTSGSGKKAWWKCSKGHEYQAEVNKRSNGSGCPYCSNQKVLAGFNDIATTNPDLLELWDYDKNDKLGIYPTNVTKGSNKKHGGNVTKDILTNNQYH